MSDRVQVQKNSSAPSQMAPSSQFQERPFTDERYQTVASAGTITADSPPQPNTVRASFNLLNMPIFAPSSGANIQEGNIQRQEEEKQEKESENLPELQTKPEVIVQAKCSQCEAEEKEKEQNSESVQAKLTVGKPGDQYEQEADSMAAKVMAMPESAVGQSIQGQTDDEKKEIQTSPLANSITPVVQRSPNSTTQASPSIENRLANSKGGGSALPDDVRSFMEPRFGADFSSVRVHTDSTAVQMNKDLGAQAFAHGSDIYYGAGKSPGKDELTAHELTHTVQQGGAARAKLETPTEKSSETDSSKTDSSNNGQTQTAITSGDTEKKTQTELSPENQGKQAENLQNGEQTPENTAKSGKPDSPQGVEIVPQQGKPTENGSEAKAEGESSPAAKAVEAAKPQEEIQLPKEAKAPGEGEKTKDRESANQDGKGESKPLKEVPEAQALKEATVDNEKANQNLEGNKEAANPEIEAEKEKGIADAGEATTKLDATNAEVAQLASAGINFALPEQEETGEGGEGAVVALKPEPSGNSAVLEQQRAQASAQASGFLAQAAGRVQTITGLGQSISGRIQAASENAKAGVMAAVEQQKAVVTAQIAQLRAQAQSEAQATIAQIQAQHQAAAAAIPQTTATARQQIDSEHTTALQTLDDRVNNQTTHIEEVYSQAGDKYRDAGVRIGDEALARSEERAKEYESKITGRDDNLWDGPLTDNRNRARANAAREVGKQYKQGLIDEANKQADQVQEGKSKDIETIQQIADKSRETLQNHHQASIDSLNAAEQQAISQAEEAQTSLTEAANNSLQATLQSLDQQQASQLQLLAGYGESQVSAIDRDAQKAIASLQDGVNQAAASLQNALKDCQAQLQGAPAPNPDELSAALAEIMGQFDSSVAKVQQQTEQGVAASEQGIAQGGQQVIGGVSTLAQTGLQESAAVVEGARTTLANLNQGATDSFNQIQEAFTTMVTNTTDSAVKGFGEVTQGIEKTFEQVNQNLESGIEKSVGDLEQGLRGAFEQMEADIHKYAEEAAAKEEPRGVQFFKTLGKVFLVVAVIVVAIVAAPAAIAAVGAVAGALGAGAALASGIGMVVGGAIVGAAAGAVIQMGNNLIDGEPIFKDIGKAALAGALGGALGGAGGALGNVLGAAGKLGAGITQSIAKFGIDVAFDIAGGIAGNLATGDPITLEGVLIGAGIGAAVQISTANLGKLGKLGQKFEGMQTRSFLAGEQFGTSLGSKINSGFGSGVDAPTVSRPDVNMPGVRSVDTEVKSPQTEVKAPETEVKAPETQVKLPETEVKAPEKQVKPPETTAPNGRSTHGDKPEIEPGVVAKERTADGHDIKVLKDGRVVRCSDCAEIRERYKNILDSNDDLRQRLDNIEKEPNEAKKAEQAKQLDAELQAIQGGKRKLDSNATDATKNVEPQSKRPRREAAERANEAIAQSGEAVAKRQGYSDAPDGYHWANQNGQPILKRNPDQADQLPELRPNPKNPQEFIPVVNPPEGYKWVSQGGKFTVKPESLDLPLPTIVHNPKTGGFIFEDGSPYVPPFAKGEWKEHKWGDPSKAPCFPPGTLVKTPKGDRNIEDLVVGDLVIAYDFESNTLVTQPVLHLYNNWTQHLVDTDIQGELITSTRRHPFWVESSGEWVPALELKSGMTLRTVAHHPVTVEFAKVYARDSTTYNLEVSQVHNYFVGTLGVLVHNGDESSNFTDTTKKSAKIYEIVDTSSGEEVVVYRGKTIQDSVNDRFKQHLTDEAAKKASWQIKYKAAQLEIRQIAGGDWTDYETAVWEKHFIDEAVAKRYPLVNDLKAHPISKDKYEAYKHLHAPCP